MVHGKKTIDSRKLLEQSYFSYESKILIGHDSRVYVWRETNEGWQPGLMTPWQSKPCTWIDDLSWECNMRRYGEYRVCKWRYKRWKILGDPRGELVTSYSLLFPAESYISKQDNAPVRRARSNQKFLYRNDVTTMSWPAESPDLTIIICNCYEKESFRHMSERSSLRMTDDEKFRTSVQGSQ